MSIQTIERNIQSLAVQMHEVVTDAELSNTEKQERYEKMETDLHALQKERADALWLDDKTKALAPLLGPGETVEDDTPKPKGSVGEQFVNAANYKTFAEHVKMGGKVGSGPIEVFNVLTTTGIGADVIAPQIQTGILPILFERLTVADLMPSSTTTSNSVRYVVETVATNAASTVAESGLKPEATLDFDTVDEPVRKIAVVLKVTDEMLEDIDQMQAYLNNRLSLFVQMREEAQLLNGAGTGNDIDGLLNRSLTAAQPKGGDSIAVAVHKEITKVRVASFLDPTGVVFHPNDWEAARLEQDQNDQFYGGGPFTGPYGNGGIAAQTYWQLPVVSTTAMTENTVLLGAFRTAAEVVRRSGIVVDMTNSDQDDFVNNRVTLRAEERVGLKVYRPAAFGTVTGV